MIRLAPSGRAFLPELSLLAEHAAAAAAVLRGRLDPGSRGAGHPTNVAAHASEADSLAAAVTKSSSQALVPPIDREDATDLASHLRVVVNGLHRLGRLAHTVGSFVPDAEGVRLADLLVQATDSLEGAAATMTERSSALDFAYDVRHVAREGDRVYVEAIGALLSATPDSLDAVRQAEMYAALLESLRDCAAAVAVIERVVLKRF